MFEASSTWHCGRCGREIGSQRAICQVCKMQDEQSRIRVESERMRIALREIAKGGCEHEIRGYCPNTHRTINCEYTDEKWCNPCIAKWGLEFTHEPDLAQTSGDAR